MLSDGVRYEDITGDGKFVHGRFLSGPASTPISSLRGSQEHLQGRPGSDAPPSSCLGKLAFAPSVKAVTGMRHTRERPRCWS